MDATPNLEPDSLTLRKEMERIWSDNGLRDAHRTTAWLTLGQVRAMGANYSDASQIIYHGPSKTAKGIKLMRAAWTRRRRVFIASLYKERNATK